MVTKLFLVGVIYVCAANGIHCGEEPAFVKKYQLTGNDPFPIKEQCEKWVSDTIWDKVEINRGQVAYGKCSLQLLKEDE